jgi:hypothetical protein
VKMLLKKGTNVDQANNNGATPLFIAAQNGHLEVVEVLLEQRANVNQAKNVGATPLYIAAQNGHLAVVKALLEKGANIDQACNTGATPLSGAAQNGHLAIVKVLLANGANVDQANNNSVTPLYTAAQNDHLAVVKMLLEQRANVNQANNNGVTPLYVAAQKGHLAIVKVLLEKGASVNQACADVKVLLHSTHSDCQALLKVAKEMQSFDLPSRLKEKGIALLIKDFFQPYARSTRNPFSLFQPHHEISEVVTALGKHPDWTYEECKDFIVAKLHKEALNPHSIPSALLWAVERLGEEAQKMQLLPSSPLLGK